MINLTGVTGMKCISLELVTTLSCADIQETQTTERPNMIIFFKLDFIISILQAIAISGYCTLWVIPGLNYFFRELSCRSDLSQFVLSERPNLNISSIWIVIPSGIFGVVARIFFTSSGVTIDAWLPSSPLLRI